MHCTVFCEFFFGLFFARILSLSLSFDLFTVCVQCNELIQFMSLAYSLDCCSFSCFVSCVTKCIPLVFDSANDHLNNPSTSNNKNKNNNSTSEPHLFYVTQSNICCAQQRLVLLAYHSLSLSRQATMTTNPNVLVHSNIWLVTSIYIHSPGRFFMSIVFSR